MFHELTTIINIYIYISPRSYQTSYLIGCINQIKFLRCTRYTHAISLFSSPNIASEFYEHQDNSTIIRTSEPSRRRPVMVSASNGWRVHARSRSASRCAAPWCRGEEEESYIRLWLGRCSRRFRGTFTLPGNLCARVSGSRCVCCSDVCIRISVHTRFTLTWRTGVSPCERRSRNTGLPQPWSCEPLTSLRLIQCSAGVVAFY